MPTEVSKGEGCRVRIKCSAEKQGRPSEKDMVPPDPCDLSTTGHSTHTHGGPVCACISGRTVLRMSATPRSTWSLAPRTVMVRSGSLGVSSDRDCTRTVAPESLMMSRTVWPAVSKTRSQ
eukprot:scaffold274479_cov18-Tisochrysis_lutea.AAC.2